MCYGCYEEAGKPIPSSAAVALGARLRGVDCFGGCHIVVDDWNLEEDDIDYCINEPSTTDDERQVMIELKALSLEQRAAAMGVACGYIWL